MASGRTGLPPRRTIARLLTRAEHGAPVADLGLGEGAGGHSWTVGITGPPGAGKSTLVAGLVSELRAGGELVAVLAVDPSSPVTGGALLGDRVRMSSHTLDDGVVIRSLGSHGHGGGVSPAVDRCAEVLDRLGFDWILVETVGVGQIEMDVMSLSDTTVVVLTPGWGDDVQANKAGLLECADVFAVNKADSPGAAEVLYDLRDALGQSGDRPPVIATTATTGAGIDELTGAIRAQRRQVPPDQRALRQRERRRTRLMQRAHDAFSAALLAYVDSPAGVATVDHLLSGSGEGESGASESRAGGAALARAALAARP